MPPTSTRAGRRRLAAALIVLAAGPLAACSSGTGNASVPAPAPAPAASPGEQIYSRSCARCHGNRLQGSSAKATPAIDAVRLSGLGDQRLRLTISSGKGKMPGFSFSAAQTDALVA